MNWTWLRTWQLGIKSMLLHPLRSALTVLGIFIGVASVIWLLAIGEGISIQAQRQIASLGADNIIVRSIKPPSEALAGQRGLIPYGITRDDYLRLMATIPTIERALPIREIRRQFRYRSRLLDGRLVGCTPDYADVTRLEIDRGHFITDVEVREEKNHCVLAAAVARRLFPLEDPIGRTLRVETDYYVVVGIVKPRNPTAGIGGSLEAQDFSGDVYIPITNLWQWIGDSIATIRAGSFEGETVELSQITLRIDDIAHVTETADVVDQILSRNRSMKDYGITVPLELLEQARTMRMMFIVLLGLIAAISLVVGGIGIMNIMLATVTERTREIGIRRALGAKRRDITRQFLAETIVLSVVGGLTGIVGGLTCGPVVRWARELLYTTMPNT
ncbi:MAG: ABC transporter permease, partial [Pirellulales bacterium]